MDLIQELHFYEDALIVESQYKQLTELFKKYQKTGITVKQVIDKILHYPIPAVKELLAKIDFTKEYRDSEIDNILLTLKNEFDKMGDAETSNARSLDDVIRTHNLQKAKDKGIKPLPTYLGV